VPLQLSINKLTIKNIRFARGALSARPGVFFDIRFSLMGGTMSVDVETRGLGSSPSQKVPCPLFLYFWLPAGKDAFGFATWQSANLSVSKDYYDDLYIPIALQFPKRLKQIHHLKNIISFFDDRERTKEASFEIKDCELRLRKISAFFVYTPAMNGLSQQHVIDGEFQFFSSGLYCFRLNILTSEKRCSSDEVEARVLAETFFKDVIEPMFNLSWEKYLSFKDASGHLVLTKKVSPDPVATEKSSLAPKKKAIEPYRGVLSYYQLELLYNVLFDAETVPHVFFTPAAQLVSGGHADREREKEIRRKKAAETYSLENIFYSIVMFSWGLNKRKHAPLKGGRKDYTLRGAWAERDENYLRPEEFEPNKRSVKSDFFYSRLTYSAMEQFIRVSTTFGVNNYRDGLGCARKSILLHNMRAKENIDPEQLYLEAKRQKGSAAQGETSEYEALTAPLSHAEIYYELIKSKIPRLLFLRDMIHDMGEAVVPLQAQQATESLREQCEGDAPEEPKGYLCEFHFSRSTFCGARRQYERQCALIEQEAEAVRHLMERAGDQQILGELTDTRKIHELTAEERPPVEISADQWNRLSAGIGYSQIGAAFAFGFLGLSVWLIDKILDGKLKELAAALQGFRESIPGAGEHLLAIVAAVATSGIAILFAARRRKAWGSFVLLALFGVALVYSGWDLSQVDASAWAAETRAKPKLMLFFAILGIFLSALSWSLSQYKAYSVYKPRSARFSGEPSTSIYDYASLRQQIPIEDTLALFNRLKNDRIMPGLFGVKTVKCRVYTVLSEMPSIGVEKRKYSFTSPGARDERSSQGGNYTIQGENYRLHVEIERHYPSNEAFLTDMRLAIRTAQDHEDRRDIDREAKRLTYYFCSEILGELRTATPERFNSLLKRYFAFSDDDVVKAAAANALIAGKPAVSISSHAPAGE
jgi:hypothetical protein